MDHLGEFFQFLSIPSVSALPEHKADVIKAADWLKNRMGRAGFADVRVIPTGGHPVVYALAPASSPGAPTVLLYGHYDVQPADPLDEWLSDPFEPVVRDGKVFARGAADDKGGVFPAILAVEGLLRENNLPVNVKFLIEGEEEIGSPNIGPVLREGKDLFKNDLVVSVDGGMWSVDVPSVTTGSRGLCGIQVDVTGPRQDVHSGGAGGAVNNPLMALAQIVSSMKSWDGKVLVEGFYDDVIPLTRDEREALARTPFDETEYKDRFGVNELFGEPGYTVYERLGARPTLDAVGMYGGFQGEGIKTIIPGRASCKITCRLVPDQEPDKIIDMLKRHIAKHRPRGVTVSVTAFPGSSRPYVIPSGHPVLPVMREALKMIYGKDPVEVRLGGTLPIARAFLDILGSYLVFFATSSPDSNAHGPNECYRLTEFDRLLRGLPVLFGELGRALKTM